MDLLALLHLLAQVMAVRFSFYIDSKNVECMEGIANQQITPEVVEVGLKFIAFRGTLANLALILQLCINFASHLTSMRV